MNVALPPPFRVLSLCAGAGGLDLGLKLAVPGAVTVGYVERDAYAAATLVARMEDAALDQAPVWDDLGAFDGRPWRGVVDCVASGFPCQPFSVAGKRRGADDDRWLWPDIARVLGEVGPAFVFLENVPGLVRHGFGLVLGDLADLGFSAEWGLVSAAAVGAPHVRSRFWLLAHARRGDDDAEQPEPVAGGGGAAGPRGPGGDVAADDREVRRSARGHSLAHPGGVRFGGGVGQPGRDGASRGREQGPPVAGDGGLALVDAEGERRDDGRAEPIVRGGRGTAGGAGGELPLFPPRPDDRAGWRDYLAASPGAEPGVLRGTDGIARRMDRLRVAGNGVVPLAAAVAFRRLYARLMER